MIPRGIMHNRHLVFASLAWITACGSNIDVDAVREHQRAWQALDIADYSFVFERSCFCSPGEEAGMRVEVDDGVVVSSVGAHSGAKYPPWVESDVTLDDLFQSLIDSARHGADSATIHYDPKYHFIDDLSLDPERGTEDDGYSLSVSCFSEDPDGCAVPQLSADECAAEGGEVRAIPESFNDLVCGDDEGGEPLGEVEPGTRICCKPFPP